MNETQPINVLSAFDGMSCGQLALQREGVPVKNYFASEIDKYAIKVTIANFPNTVQLGSITDVSIKEGGIFVKGALISSEIPDLLIGGSPCQGFSFAGKQLNFEDPRSALFFEFVRIYKEIKAINPNVKFLLENVKMKKEYMKVITDIMEVEPVEINSALVSAQNRKRLYWTNINDGFILQPKDRNAFLKDIIHENSFSDRDKSNCITAGFQQTSPGDYFNRSQGQMVFDTGRPLSEKEVDYMLNDSGNWSPSNNNRFETYLNFPDKKHGCLTANFNKGVPYNCTFEELKRYIVPFDKTLQILDKQVEKGKIGFFRKDSQANRVYYVHGKTVTLNGSDGGGANKMGQYLFGCTTPDIVNKSQNGQIFNDGKKFYTLTSRDRHGILIEHIISWSGKGSDIFQSVAKAFHICDEHGYDNLDFDADGLGAGVKGDARVLNEKRTKPIMVSPFRGSASPVNPQKQIVEGRTNEDFFANAKAQAWWALRERFKKTHRAVVDKMEYNKDDIISISSLSPEYMKLITELSQPTYSLNNAGKVIVDKTPDGMKSPNLADSVMMAFAPTKSKGFFA